MFPETYEIAVAGVTFEGRQDLLTALHREQERGVRLAGGLLREPDNRHDPKAIRVMVRTAAGGWRHVGYVPRDLAAKLAPRLDAGEEPVVTHVRILMSDHNRRVTFGARITVEIRKEEAM